MGCFCIVGFLVVNIVVIHPEWAVFGGGKTKILVVSNDSGQKHSEFFQKSNLDVFDDIIIRTTDDSQKLYVPLENIGFYPLECCYICGLLSYHEISGHQFDNTMYRGWIHYGRPTDFSFNIVVYCSEICLQKCSERILEY